MKRNTFWYFIAVTLRQTSHKLASASRKLLKLYDSICYKTKCKVCGAYYGHAIDCPSPRREKEWKKIAMTYYIAWNRDKDCNACSNQQRFAMKWRKKSEYWQGKFHTLRLENNALRKQLERKE